MAEQSTIGPCADGQTSEISIPGWVSKPIASMKETKLTVKKSGKVVEEIYIDEKPVTTFGRNSELVDVFLDHESISRRHAAIIHNNSGNIFLIDFGSSNGTFVNSRELERNKPVQLKNGNSIRFGESPKIYYIRIPQLTNQNDLEVDEEKTNLPVSFGRIDKKNDGETQTRKEREAIIAEMTASFLRPVPQYTMETKNNNINENKNEASKNDDAQESEEEEEEKKSRNIDFGEEEMKLSEEEENQRLQDALHRNLKEREIPVSHFIELREHTKTISCISIESSGSRLVTGSLDYYLRFWDFGGMDRSHCSFRSVEPDQGNYVIDLSHSPTGDRFICATGSAQPKIFDRDGIELLKFVKGDPYISDPVHTKGHIGEIHGCQWHPIEKNEVITCSVDGTIRIWDLEGPTAFSMLTNKHVIRVKNQRGTKVSCTACCYNPDGSIILGGCADGSLQMFSTKKRTFSRPDGVVRNAHSGCEVTSVCFSPDGHLVVSRGLDNTVKLWDIRRFSSPLKVIENVSTLFAKSNVAFSPNGRIICCGTSIPKESSEHSKLKFYDVKNTSTEPLLSIDVETDASAICVQWHAKIKQIFCGTTKGVTKVFYDPTISVKGALMSNIRNPKKSGIDGWVPQGHGTIFNPHALPMYREESHGKRKRAAKDRLDPVKSKRPELPLNGPGAGGRVSSSYNFTQFVMQSIRKDTFRDQDARNEVLKYAEISKVEPIFVDRAYANTQPKPVLMERTLEQEQEDIEQEKKKILES